MDFDEVLIWMLVGAIKGLLLAALTGRWIAVPLFAAFDPLAILVAGAIDDAIFRIGLFCGRMRYLARKARHA